MLEGIVPALVTPMNKNFEVDIDGFKSYVKWMKGFTGICQTCGTRTKFTVDKFGYATCGNCRAIASYKFGHVA